MNQHILRTLQDQPANECSGLFARVVAQRAHQCRLPLIEGETDPVAPDESRVAVHGEPSLLRGESGARCAGAPPLRAPLQGGNTSIQLGPNGLPVHAQVASRDVAASGLLDGKAPLDGHAALLPIADCLRLDAQNGSQCCGAADSVGRAIQGVSEIHARPWYTQRGENQQIDCAARYNPQQ